MKRKPEHKKMNQRNKDLHNRILLKNLSLTMAVSLIFSVFTSAQVYASSPEFARTDEEWASLSDNNMDYGEIEGLIEEYNATVQNNQYEYRKFRNDYGDSKTDVSDSYRDLAQELRDAVEYPDVEDANYASAALAALTNDNTAKSLETQADNNLEDAEIKRLTYEMAKMTLVQTAQNNMISYHTGLLDIDDAKNASELANKTLAVTQGQNAAGTATGTDVITASSAALSATQAITDQESALKSTKQKLCVMLGWAADSSPVIGNIPEPDLSRIEAMNPAVDLEKACSNNYTLLINQKKLANSISQTDKDTLNTTIADNRQKIASSLTGAYQNVISARDAYIYALSNADLQNSNLALAVTKNNIGTISAYELAKQENTSKTATNALAKAKLALFEAMENYDWMVNGLASAS